jgi:photosystem II stability/assembly factor-like uncharacterized protein
MRRSPAVSAFLALTLIIAVPAVAVSQRYTISGRIEIEGRSSHGGIIVWVDLLHSTQTDDGGYYEIGDLDNGDYSVFGAAEYCLAAVIGAVTVSGGDVIDVDGSLFPGDLRPDGRINLYDSGEILAAFNSTSDSSLWDPVLDLNADSIIDSLDIAVLIDRWKESSDVKIPQWRMIVTAPDESAVWWTGQQNVPIGWTTANAGGDVSIFLCYGSETVDTVALSTPNDGSFDEYDVPGDLPSDGGYRILVRQSEELSAYSAYFEIRIPVVVYNPDAESVWWPGFEYGHIQWWNRAELGGNVSLYLYKGEDPIDTIIESLPISPSFHYYEVPTDLETGVDYRILLRHDDLPQYEDFSDEFAIRAKFEVMRPHRYTTWYTGQQGIAVEWEDSELGGTVSISLYIGSVLIENIATETENDGIFVNYDYIVPYDLEESDNYRIQVYYDETYNDYGERFEVADPPYPDQYGWIQVSPGTALWDVSMSSGSSATAVGAKGAILRTDDGGYTWRRQESTTYHTLYGVSFSDAVTGTAVGVDGIVLHTNDGGLNWERQRPYVISSLFDVEQIGSNVAIAVGESGRLIRTIDGGANWEIIDSGVPDILRCISFVDSDNGWATGHSSRILVTTDGGDTWTIEDSGHSYPATDISFYDDLTGAIASYNCDEFGCSYQILMTSDGGTTWQRKLWGSEGYARHYALDFADQSVMTVIGPMMIGTEDGGDTWTGHPDYMFHYLYGIDYASGGTGMASGSSGEVLLTNDFGDTWSSIKASTFQHIMDVEFIDANAAVAVGYDGIVLKTNDGGSNWHQLQTLLGMPILYSVSFTGADTGMVAGDAGTIFSTVDGGATWTDRSGHTSLRFWGIELRSGLAPITVGDNGTIIQSPDGGSSWLDRNSGTSSTLRAVSFGSPSLGTIVGYGGTILRSSDGGSGWTAQSSPTSENLYDVEFIDELHGMAVGASGIVLRTSDGGTNWELLSTGSSVSFLSVSYTDPNTATIAGNNGTIMRTANGGDIWVQQPCGTARDLWGVSFSGQSNGVVVGRTGIILYTATGGQ